MVNRDATRRWTKRLFDPLLGKRRVEQCGLRTYDLRRPGGRRRFHLRSNADGSAVLLIDATDAIHLNPTAALLARLAFDGVPVERAAAALRRQFRGVSAAQARSDAERIYALVERLTDATDRCPTCTITSAAEAMVKWQPPFSVPISAPYKADLALTYDCNNNCRHCYNQCPRPRAAARSAEPVGSPLKKLVSESSGATAGLSGSVSGISQKHTSGQAGSGTLFQQAGGSSTLSTKQWYQVLDRLAAVGVPHIIYTGGEPTLFDSLPDLIRRAADLGLVSGLNTNGRRLSDAGYVESLRSAGLDHVQITLQSDDRAVHNAMCGAAAFDETVRGLKNSLAADLHAITNTTLTRRNIGQAGRLVDFLHDLGLTVFAMNGMIFAGGGLNCGDEIGVEELAPVLADVRDRAAQRRMRFLWYTPTEYCRLSPVELELGPRRCNAGEYSICIEPNGDVIPCQSYYVPVGNILRDSWPTIWESALFRRFRNRGADPRAAGLPASCWECPDLPLCGGGCPLERDHRRSVSNADEGSKQAEMRQPEPSVHA